MEPRYNEPLDNEVLGITNDIPSPSNTKTCVKEAQYKIITKHPYSEHIWFSPLSLCYTKASLYRVVSFSETKMIVSEMQLIFTIAEFLKTLQLHQVCLVQS